MDVGVRGAPGDEILRSGRWTVGHCIPAQRHLAVLFCLLALFVNLFTHTIPTPRLICLLLGYFNARHSLFTQPNIPMD